MKDSYLQNETRFNFDNNNSLIFKTRENKEKVLLNFIISCINIKTIV